MKLASFKNIDIWGSLGSKRSNLGLTSMNGNIASQYLAIFNIIQ